MIALASSWRFGDAYFLSIVRQKGEIGFILGKYFEIHAGSVASR